MKPSANISERDAAFVWHPYTQMQLEMGALAIVRGEGARLFDEHGKSYIDAISSWWVNLHGHAHPYIAQKIYEQARKLQHVMFAGFTHETAVLLAERLLGHLPNNQARIFFSDNGSTAVEVAMKMAVQFWGNQGERRSRFVVLDGGYHGDTVGAMSLSQSSAFFKPYEDLLFEVCVVPAPIGDSAEDALAQLETELKRGSVAAFLYEPLIMGASGMRMYEPEILDRMLKLVHEAHSLCIADEVMTGFGRTGKFLASDYVAEKPDIICLSKGITGGSMAFGVTSCAKRVYDAFLSERKERMFFHGHSYTANPLACAASLASLDLLEQRATWESIERIAAQQRDFVRILQKNERVLNPRCFGTIAAFDISENQAAGYFSDVREKVAAHCLSQGVVIRPLGNVVYVLPPYCILESELQYVHSTVLSAL